MQLLAHVLGLGLRFSIIHVKHVLGLGLGLRFSIIHVKHVLGLGFRVMMYQD
jgi:hypothetical protein